METSSEHDKRIANLTLGNVYPLYLAKVTKKNRTQEELNKAKEQFAVAEPGVEVASEEVKEEDAVTVKKSNLAERITAKFGQKEWL